MAESIFRVWMSSRHAIVRLPARIGVDNASELRRILTAVTGLYPVILVDLSETGFLDCAALGGLLEGLHRASAADRELRLVVGCPAQLRTLTLAGLSSFFRVYRSVAEALAVPQARPGPADPGSLESPQVG